MRESSNSLVKWPAKTGASYFHIRLQYFSYTWISYFLENPGISNYSPTALYSNLLWFSAHFPFVLKHFYEVKTSGVLMKKQHTPTHKSKQILT